MKHEPSVKLKKNKVSEVCRKLTEQWMENCLHMWVCVSVCVCKRFHTYATHAHVLAYVSYGCVCMRDGQLRVCCVSSNCTHVEKTNYSSLPLHVEPFFFPSSWVFALFLLCLFAFVVNFFLATACNPSSFQPNINHFNHRGDLTKFCQIRYFSGRL